MQTLRRVFLWIHLVASALVVVGVFVQVYLAAAALRGATDLQPHADSGWLVHTLELVVFVAALVAWLPRKDIVWSFVLAAFGTVQVLLVELDRWLGALHGAGALFVLIIASILVHRDFRHLGLKRGPDDAAVDTAPPPPSP